MVIKLLMGNEAIAHGAVEAGVKVAAAYPASHHQKFWRPWRLWLVNMVFIQSGLLTKRQPWKLPLASHLQAARSLAAMKQVGLNVAADPLMSLAYIGIKGAWYWW
ncbi:MAG: hypothetical protein RQM92_09175 [Candidatus Syntrophopropionicum ammoniitolerans]